MMFIYLHQQLYESFFYVKRRRAYKSISGRHTPEYNAISIA